MRVSAGLILGLVAVGALAVTAVVVPLPGPVAVREWVTGLGPAAVLVFMAAYCVCTAAPLPRTVFNLAAGLLFGEFVGVAVAVVATVISGLLGFLLARGLGRDLVSRYLRHPRVATVDTRLAHGGWPAVASLRLIPVIPFAPLSYCCGVSSLSWRAYLTGTAVGSVPGTVAVVVLGDALTGTTPPTLLGCYAAFAVLGALGLWRAVATGDTEPVVRAGKSHTG